MLEATLNRGAPRTRSRSGRHRSFWTMLSGLGLALALPAGRAGADAVMLVPACIVLDVTTDSATVVVHNRGTSAVTWQLDLVRMGRTAAGRLRPVAPREPSAAAVDSSIVVSPRECVIAAGESRTIRIHVRHGRALPAGEYRSHLLVREKPALTAAGEDDGFGAGAAVPIVLRSGPAAPRWRDEQFRPGATRTAPAIVILDLEPRRPDSAT